MSSFLCPECKEPIIDSQYGYITGCKHYPVKMPAKVAKAIEKNGGLELPERKVDKAGSE